MRLSNDLMPPVLRLAAVVVFLFATARPAAGQPGTVSLSGHVTDGGGTGIAGVTLNVTGGPTAVPPLTTDGGGAFSVAGLGPAVYTVTPRGPAVSNAPASRTVTCSRAPPSSTSSGRCVSHTISGRWRRRDGARQLRQSRGDRWRRARVHTTDAAGRFALFQVDAGGRR